MRKKSRALEGRCLSMRGEILSRPDAEEQREDMA
jgi:hypothetical protein